MALARRWRRHSLAFLVTTAAAIGCREAGGRIQTTTTILPPAAGGEAFEPSIAIDPGNPNRLLVSAKYGVPFARGGTGIWVWRSSDGGRSWADGPLEPPRMPGVDVAPTFAADVITGFARDGSPLLASKADAPPLGGTFLSHFSATRLTSRPFPCIATLSTRQPGAECCTTSPGSSSTMANTVRIAARYTSRSAP